MWPFSELLNMVSVLRTRNRSSKANAFHFRQSLIQFLLTLQLIHNTCVILIADVWINIRGINWRTPALEIHSMNGWNQSKQMSILISSIGLLRIMSLLFFIHAERRLRWHRANVRKNRKRMPTVQSVMWNANLHKITNNKWINRIFAYDFVFYLARRKRNIMEYSCRKKYI